MCSSQLIANTAPGLASMCLFLSCLLTLPKTIWQTRNSMGLRTKGGSNSFTGCLALRYFIMMYLIKLQFYILLCFRGNMVQGEKQTRIQPWLQTFQLYYPDKLSVLSTFWLLPHPLTVLLWWHVKCLAQTLVQVVDQ